MKIVVTGAHGKVGRATTQALLDAGHDVLAVDLSRASFERAEEGTARYQQADLTDAGEAFAVVRGSDVVVHCAAIPEPTHNPPHVVFQHEPDVHVQRAGGGGALRRQTVRQHLQRDRPWLLLSRA